MTLQHVVLTPTKVFQGIFMFFQLLHDPICFFLCRVFSVKLSQSLPDLLHHGQPTFDHFPILLILYVLDSFWAFIIFFTSSLFSHSATYAIHVCDATTQPNVAFTSNGRSNMKKVDLTCLVAGNINCRLGDCVFLITWCIFMKLATNLVFFIVFSTQASFPRIMKEHIQRVSETTLEIKFGLIALQMANNEFHVGHIISANLYHVIYTNSMDYFFDLTTNELDVFFSFGGVN